MSFWAGLGSGIGSGLGGAIGGAFGGGDDGPSAKDTAEHTWASMDTKVKFADSRGYHRLYALGAPSVNVPASAYSGDYSGVGSEIGGAIGRSLGGLADKKSREELEGLQKRLTEAQIREVEMRAEEARARAHGIDFETATLKNSVIAQGKNKVASSPSRATGTPQDPDVIPALSTSKIAGLPWDWQFGQTTEELERLYGDVIGAVYGAGKLGYDASSSMPGHQGMETVHQLLRMIGANDLRKLRNLLKFKRKGKKRELNWKGKGDSL